MPCTCRQTCKVTGYGAAAQSRPCWRRPWCWSCCRAPSRRASPRRATPPPHPLPCLARTGTPGTQHAAGPHARPEPRAAAARRRCCAPWASRRARRWRTQWPPRRPCSARGRRSSCTGALRAVAAPLCAPCPPYNCLNGRIARCGCVALHAPPSVHPLERSIDFSRPRLCCVQGRGDA